MRSAVFSMLILLGLVLSACSGGTPAATATLAQPTAPASQPTTPASRENISAGCTIQSPRPTPGPTEVSIFPPIRAEEWTLGPEQAPVTILVYSDFQSEPSARFAAMMTSVLEQFPEEVRFVFRHLPLIGTPENPYHDKAALAAQAAEAAGEQGKFWEMHDLLFERQSEWTELEPEAFQEWLENNSGELELDQERFMTVLNSEESVSAIQAAWEHAAANGMLISPLILVNGQFWPPDIPLPEATLVDLIRVNLLESRQFTTCPPMEIDPNREYTATIETEKGNIVIALFADKAPIAVNNFIFLARQGWYDGVTFHRVLPGFMAQTGDPSGTGYGGPGYAFVNEDAGIKFDRAGLVAMANSGVDTNGSQFFITYGPASHLDGGFTIFGEVLRGMDVAESLTPRNPEQGPGLPSGDKILSITITEE